MTSAAAQSPSSAALGEMLLRQSPGCTWLLRRDRVLQAIYGDAPRVFGRPAAELEGASFIDLLAPSARATWERRIERVFTGQTLCAACRFPERASVYSIALFPVKSPAGDVAYAGGSAYEMPEPGVTQRMFKVLENDRARLSTLLHDHVGQHLSAAGLQLDLLRMDLADAAFPVAERTGQIQAMLERIMGLIRDLNRELNPAVAERVGLCAALDGLAGRIRADFKGNVRLRADSTIHIPPEAAGAFYRIAQEATRHAARHAGCSRIEILLKSLRGGIELEIRDNGLAFDPAEGLLPGRGLGLLLMQHDSGHPGIDLEVHSAPDSGTVVRAFCTLAEMSA